MAKKNNKIRIIPLGGLDEIGKNLTVIEYGNDIFLIDCGMAFPDDDMPGVDLVINDISYLEKHANKIRAIFVTHGHEDHIGGIPYFLKQINVPVYGTRMTLGLVEHKLKEHSLLLSTKLIKVRAGDVVNITKDIKVEFIHTNHSIADSVAIAMFTPLGTILHMGDFKIDTTPIVGDIIDLTRIGELGKNGVLALMSDSTNVERPGFSMSERTVGDTFEKIFKDNADKRIIVATFASNVHRVQQIINAAVKNNRKVAVSGRSMETIIEVAIMLGYMTVPEGVLINIDAIKKYNPNQIVLVTTGSQGEPMSALTRMAYSDHRKVEITSDDLIIISASPIPGNEKAVSNVVNELFKIGATVIYKALSDVHVSGHACAEELKMILALTKPKYFIPVHGERRHLIQHARLARQMNIDEKNTFVLENGNVLEIDDKGAKLAANVTAGKILVDGLGVGDVGNIVLRDRKHLAEDGLIIIVVNISSNTRRILSGPDVISRGFVYVRESEGLIDSVKDIARDSLERCNDGKTADWTTMKNSLKNNIAHYIYEKTKRSPMILPIIMEV